MQRRWRNERRGGQIKETTRDQRTGAQIHGEEDILKKRRNDDLLKRRRMKRKGGGIKGEVVK